MTRVTLTIERVGDQGDGLARHHAETVIVPGTAPGDRVTVELRPGGTGTARVAALREIVQAGAQRRTPPCAHFGRCGGCTAQQLAPAAYRNWKRGRVIDALVRRAGLGAAGAERLTADLIATPADGRRRVTFVAAKSEAGLVFGLHQRRSHAIEEIGACPILRPALARLIDPLRRTLAESLTAGQTVDVRLTECANGIDLLLSARGAGGLPPDHDAVARLAQLAEPFGIVRVSWRNAGNARAARDARPLLQLAEPVVTFDGVQVALPPGAFLQASAAGEAAIVAAAMAGLKRARARGAAARVPALADLYCGLGALSLPAADLGYAVTAVDIDPSAVTALTAAGRTAGRSLTVEHRNLARHPLSARELARFDAVLIDPPRAGAAAQTAVLADLGSDRPAAIVYVSCAPASFARDARRLHAAGYALRRVAPIDQFVYSFHVELVAYFEDRHRRA